MFYVTMTDTFMSGWGKAEGKKNKLVFECDTLKEAEIVKDNAENRDEMKYVNINDEKPNYYPKENYFVQIKTKDDYPAWYKREGI